MATAAAAAETPAAAELERHEPVEPTLTPESLAEPASVIASEPVILEVVTEPQVEAQAETAQTDATDEVPSVPKPAPGESAADAFAAAASAFGIAADEAPRAGRRARTATAPQAEPVATPAADVPHRVRRRAAVSRKILAGSATLGIMGLAGMIAVSMTLPTSAVAAAQGSGSQASTSLVSTQAGTDAAVDDEEIQAYVASSDVKAEETVRTEDFDTVSMSDVAAEEGIAYSTSVYTNDPTAAIQWPFVVGVAMSSTYGMRNGRMHEGIDLVPGSGAPIQSIADGTVRIATEAGGNYGVTVYIDHVIDGQVITSHYSHMQYGSLRVKTGDKVKVGDVVGKVGNTGRSYGAHLHFELIANGAKIDPLPWLQNNAGRTSY